MDRITLTGLRVPARHGVLQAERLAGQTFVVDLVLEIDLAPAAASDDLADTVDYGELTERVFAIVAGEPVNLIEALAERVATACLADPRVVAATVTVHKPEAPIVREFADVAVTVRRGRRAPTNNGRQPVAKGGQPVAEGRQPVAEGRLPADEDHVAGDGGRS